MKNNDNIYKLTQEGLHFFGRMSASATHEIKNTLAIINENIGLMNDMAMISQDGMMPIEQINIISKNIKKQVRRSNSIIQRLNQFSHKVDLSKQQADLEHTVKFTLEVASRLIDMHEVVIEIIPATAPLRINANQFFLENLVWRAVESACHGVQKTKKISISFIKDMEISSIRFIMDQTAHDFMDNLFNTDVDKALIDYMNVTIEKNRETNSFGLIWSTTN